MRFGAGRDREHDLQRGTPRIVQGHGGLRQGRSPCAGVPPQATRGVERERAHGFGSEPLREHREVACGERELALAPREPLNVGGLEEEVDRTGSDLEG